MNTLYKRYWMQRLTVILLILWSIAGLMAQNIAPEWKPLTDGNGIYAGLKKCPYTCKNTTGNFYVAPTDDASAVAWFFDTKSDTTVTNPTNGWMNVQQLFKLSYHISLDSIGLSPELSVYPDGIKLHPAGAVEVCFRKNYDAQGVLISGTTLQNMWYLPSQNELMQMMIYCDKNPRAFGESFSEDIYYWSSSEYSNPGFAWGTYFGAESNSNYSGYTNAYEKYKTEGKVRCVRR